MSLAFGNLLVRVSLSFSCITSNCRYENPNFKSSFSLVKICIVKSLQNRNVIECFIM